MARNIRKKNVYSVFSKYLPVLIILLSVTIILGSTFAYFTDKVEREASLTLSKVELSSETTTGINGEVRDVIPGTPLTNGALKFSKSIDSEAIYVRAKILFTLPNEYKDDENMGALIKSLRDATDYNIFEDVQNNAVWSVKEGNYFYLLNSEDTSRLKRVDDISTYVLSNEIVIPRDLESLDNNAQYMKSVNFHVAFEAIQADNVSDIKAEAKETFNAVFPQAESEKNTVQVTFDILGNSVAIEVEKGEVLTLPQVDMPLNANGEPEYVVTGWYTDSALTTEVVFGDIVNNDITLYPKVQKVTNYLTFVYLTESDSYSVGTSISPSSNYPIVVPNTYKNKPVTAISAKGFSSIGTYLTSIYLPDTITDIGDEAFNNCKNLVLNKLPSSLVSVGTKAFYYCSNLNVDKLPSGMVSIGENAFTYCKGLMLEEFPSSLITIGVSAFNGCTGITATELPSGVTSIGGSAFLGCTNLALTSLPDGITSIDRTTFHSCTNLALTSLPDGITSIGYMAFTDCKNISFTELPDSILSIDSYAFSGCSNLALTSLPSNLTEIKNNTFANCTSLALTSLPDGIVTIGTYAFSSCTNLKLTSLSSSLKTIENNAFSSCRTMPLALLPDGLETIGEFAFDKCYALKLTTLPSSLTKISLCAFQDCRGIISMTLPESIVSIASSAFEDCRNMKYLYIPSTVTSIGGRAVDSTSIQYLLCGSAEVYTLASGKGVDAKYMYTLQESGYPEDLTETEVVIDEAVTLYVVTGWVRTVDNKCFKK